VFDVKQILIKPINSTVARAFIKAHHYSGKVVNNSTLHFGAFHNNRLHGVMSFGNSLDKRKMLGLVKGTLWNEFLELNRMAFDDTLPKNSESRSLSIAFRLIRKHYSHIKWIVSFADGTQCGDGTIYRASGFVLTGIVENSNTCKMQNGEVIHKMTLESNPTSPRKELNGKSYYDVTNGKYDFNKYIVAVSGKKLKGYQIRYIYFLHTGEKQNLTVPTLPFSKIDELNAGMYRGQKISLAERRLCAGSVVARNLSKIEAGTEMLTPALQN
jgi:hypothetical protein